MAPPEAEVDELYRVPLAEFTTARNDLAKKLKAEGRTEEADEVKALRKPTVAVWLVNRLAQERELDVQRLRKAGETLAKATALRSPDEFLEAQHEQHRALARLGDAARELASREGVSATAADRALETLRAASLTEEGRELLKRGTLTEELEPPGFEALAGLVGPAPSKKKAAAPKSERDDRRQALKEARERLKELRAEERDLTGAAHAAEREAERAEKQAAQLREHADEARAAAKDAAERTAEAEEEIERLS
jgi:hypothetical protein